MNKLNKALYQTYTVIREKKLFTLIVLPSFFDLNPRFRKRRVRVLFHAKYRCDNRCLFCDHFFTGNRCPKCLSGNFKPGFLIFDVYNQKQIHEILERNKHRSIKSLNVGVQPVVKNARIKEYKGSLLPNYEKLKKEKLAETIKNLQNEIDPDIPKRKTCSHLYFYLKRKEAWVCRRCNHETKINPFDNEELKEVPKE